MIHCHHCETDNLDGSEFCDECGTKLAPSATLPPGYQAPQPAPPPPPVRQSAAAPSASETSGPAGNRTVALQAQTNSLRNTQEENMTARAKLVIQRGGKVGKEFAITGAESMIGRWDADGGIFPDVDLDQDDPEAKVSRRHARIYFQNNQYLIEDLGSTNGTFVNRGPRLLPGNKQPLNNGDEIIVGKTFLKFILN